MWEPEQSGEQGCFLSKLPENLPGLSKLSIETPQVMQRSQESKNG